MSTEAASQLNEFTEVSRSQVQLTPHRISIRDNGRFLGAP
jgi:hypothetical protein